VVTADFLAFSALILHLNLPLVKCVEPHTYIGMQTNWSKIFNPETCKGKV